MARRTTVTKTTTTRESKATSRKSTDQPATGEAAPSSSLGLAEAIAITTTVMLIAAILMTDYFLGHKLGSGVFLKP